MVSNASSSSISQLNQESQMHQGLNDAITRAADFLLKSQHEDGYWVGELEGDTILESEYILLMCYLRQRDESELLKCAEYIRRKQMDNGGWALFPGGPVDVSSSLKAYWALKLTGTSPDEPYMVRAREAIWTAGGVPVVNSYTRFYLALLGEISWNCAPAVPPELMYLPPWFYFNIYEISSWSRTFVVPLSIMWHHKITVPVDDFMGIGELFREGEKAAMRLNFRAPVFTWRNFFIGTDKAIKFAESLRLLPGRKRAIAKAEQWMIEHFNYSAGLGAIFPPIIYSLIAMHSLGYEPDNSLMKSALQELRNLQIEEDGAIRIQPCMSPVWDTAIVMNALAEAGVSPDNPILLKAAKWLLSKEVKIRGDWQVKRPRLERGGWYFEFANDFYPDIDDTAMVLMALKKVGDLPGKQEAMDRAMTWELGMQSSNGGWASFDVDNNKHIFNAIPFADHNAMLDPPTSDITARILEMFSYFDIGKEHVQAQNGIDFVRRTQEPDGSWYGRWGVNYIYGTWQSIRGLTRIGLDLNDPSIRRGVDWLRNVQNEDGGWGESCISYNDSHLKARCQSTASQTAWAIMGLMSAGEISCDAVTRGVNFLTSTQNKNGTWEEEFFTGSGFPKVFYLRYHLYRHSFPLMALGMYRRLSRS